MQDNDSLEQPCPLETPDSITTSGTSVCSNGLLVCDIPTLELNTRLKEQWSPYHKGACHLLSKGHYCKCHLCLVDELTSRALGKAD